ncbi:hypothetical protein BDZ94DRAFT_1278880 [Collybia nuda]|uniref:BHLH domain-containing protein n=1 Tax=Collybia nuda TaxID=64659 RepID=A0A9P5YJG1_9AGAR|nr:hypothetical protein BDZ94DRAFT_1278880 [Collybia nuda]
MDFEHSKTSSYMDSMDNGPFTYMDTGLEYLQGYTHDSPAFGIPVGLPASGSPLGFNTLNLSTSIGEYSYSSPSFSAPSPARPYTPPDGASISPPSLMYNSAGELSSDGMPSSGRHSRGSGTHSPPASIPYAATVPRSHRFNPLASPATRASIRGAHRRRSSRSNDDSDDEDDDFQPALVSGGNADSRRETIRKQRIESEQRRRDELRDGYARLKETLPASNQKSSKVSLLDRATGHLRYLETVKDQLEMRLKAAETEVHRLRNVNEALMLSTARHAVATAPQASF